MRSFVYLRGLTFQNYTANKAIQLQRQKAIKWENASWKVVQERMPGNLEYRLISYCHHFTYQLALSDLRLSRSVKRQKDRGS